MIQLVITTWRAHCVLPGWVEPVSGRPERGLTKSKFAAARAGERS